VVSLRRIFWRGGDEPTAPVTEFGNGLLELMRGAHPPNADDGLHIGSSSFRPDATRWRYDSTLFMVKVTL
jgi:hypothetical protein